jgi:hypothetical protein
MLNPQQAYIRGLDDAEKNVINILTQTILGEDDAFPNPELEKVRQVIKKRSDYYRSLAFRNNNTGGSFRKAIKEEHDSLGLDVPPPQARINPKLLNQKVVAPIDKQ